MEDEWLLPVCLLNNEKILYDNGKDNLCNFAPDVSTLKYAKHKQTNKICHLKKTNDNCKLSMEAKPPLVPYNLIF